MDRLGLKVLEAELTEDLRIVADALALARQRFGGGSPPELEACAYHLQRFYNTVEQLAVRVVKAFEHHLEEDAGGYVQLLRRVSIAIPGIRPALFSKDLVAHLQELRAFRHVVRHAYDLALERSRVEVIVGVAVSAGSQLPTDLARFLSDVRAAEGWTDP